ncbi:MAG: DUF4419 domain-containing protein [Candidatus Pacebacteria bacterium]|nr:DUF4419 domain-containing protein [Candidatus Paceibacterota bacterium]
MESIATLGKKIPIQDVKITVPAISGKHSSTSKFWSRASMKRDLMVVYSKESCPAAVEFDSYSSTIPFSLPAALLLAYNYHADVLIRPDDVWIMACFNLARHINLNSEKLRHMFVDHEGKKQIKINRPESFADMDWESVTEDLADAIQKEVKGDLRNTLACNFSTSGPIEYVASLLGLISSMKHFFECCMAGGCGIRNVYMTGTAADWKKLREKVASLAKFEFEDWVDRMLYIVDNFIATFEGKPDLKFWNYMVDNVDGINTSGERTPKSDFSGWLINFYAYDEDKHRVGKMMKVTDFPRVVLKSRVKVIDLAEGGKEYKMKFMTGFSGISCTNGVFAPQLSYAYAYKIRM